ncbi:hypothetical protein [Nocardioides zeae]|uniref:DUF3761 domain-containing protein n=1 Tax=Nocardioides zeae TaxID=1457234 RepID=A0AAJ1U377_9ACTN|nr:hypothetical protein [Nocardioides zeae]MDQ1106484.1 hypothetical protein [Nocardioides zeae]
MRFRTLIAAVLLVLTGLVAAPAVGSAAPAAPAAAAASCTKTSSGTCIKGGQFCPKKSYGKSGYDKNHKRWVCKGDRNHPKWTKP